MAAESHGSFYPQKENTQKVIAWSWNKVPPEIEKNLEIWKYYIEDWISLIKTLDWDNGDGNDWDHFHEWYKSASHLSEQQPFSSGHSGWVLFDFLLSRVNEE